MKTRSSKRMVYFTACFVIALLARAYLTGAPLCAGEEGAYKGLDVMCDVISIIQRDYIEKVASDRLMRGALRGMLRSLDGYSYYIPAGSSAPKDRQRLLGTYGLEVAYKDKVLTVISPIEGGPAWKAGLKPGDRIIKINEKAVGLSSLGELWNKFRGDAKEEIQLKVIRRGAHDFLDFTLEPGRIEGPQVSAETMEEKIGRLRISRFDGQTAAHVSDSMKSLLDGGADSLIVDLRDCPGGDVEDAITVADLFLPAGSLVASLKGRAEGMSKEFKAGKEPLSAPGGPLVILVNEGTSGAAEVLAGALRYSASGILMGRDSFGSAYHESTFPLGDGSRIRLVTGVYVAPDGRTIQGKGLTVDIPVEAEAREAEGEEKEEKKEEKGEEKEKKEKTDPMIQSAIDLIKGIRIIEGSGRP